MSENHDRRSFLIAAAAAAGAVAIPRGASAWVPPSDFLIGRMADKRKNLKTLSVKGIRTFVGRSFEGGKQDVAETMLVNVTDGAYRIERKTPKGTYVEVSDGSKRVSVNEGKAGAIEADPRSLERLLFHGASKEELMRAALQFGIRPDVTALGRVNGHIAWILGAKDGDTASPQLWIDKEKHVPLELRDPRAKRVIKYDGWSEPGGSGAVPGRMSIYRGDDLAEQLKVEETKVNPKVAADLLKPDAPLPATPTPTPAPSPKPSATPKATPKPTPKTR